MSDSILTSAPCAVEHWRQQEGLSHAEDCLAEEVPVALVYGGISYAVMMATPDALEQFALGFSLTEGLIETADEIYSVDVSPVELELGPGLQVDIDVSQRRLRQLKERRRNLAGRTGCGLCGSESLDGAIRPINRVEPLELISPDAIDRALSNLIPRQRLKQLTGAVHGAAWCDTQGDLVLLFEDVGRHNALDKLVGEMTRQAIDPRKGFVLMTSRGSYEVIHKCAAANVATLVCISAPTGLAVKLAQQAGMNLVGFARSGKHTIYARGQARP
ncbi:MAG TPA: formate dehydrogenase accessory sulfurtransferase FdhD [Marinobacterium sp.]|nr:formate dehydrogenase accessory sulfurtransferase FdhD [Marinobacterium sp.]